MSPFSTAAGPSAASSSCACSGASGSFRHSAASRHGRPRACSDQLIVYALVQLSVLKAAQCCYTSWSRLAIQAGSYFNCFSACPQEQAPTTTALGEILTASTLTTGQGFMSCQPILSRLLIIVISFLSHDSLVISLSSPGSHYHTCTKLPKTSGSGPEKYSCSRREATKMILLSRNFYKTSTKLLEVSTKLRKTSSYFRSYETSPH